MEKSTELNLTAADISAALLFTASEDDRQACNALHLLAGLAAGAVLAYLTASPMIVLPAQAGSVWM